MATKLLWKKEKGLGNWLFDYKCYVRQKNGINIHLTTITEFTKGDFILPAIWFPRNPKTFRAKRTKSLEAAKAKCQKWFDEFIKYNQ